MVYQACRTRSRLPPGKSAGVVVENFFQPIADVAHLEAKTVTKGGPNNNKGNRKGKVRLECAAVVQFMRSRRCEVLINVCLNDGGMNNKRLGGRLLGDVCREWWEGFARMCVYAWPTGWLYMDGQRDGCPGGGGGVGRLRECSILMGKAHLVLPWPKPVWSHLWINHMYFFCPEVEILVQIFMLCHGRRPQYVTAHAVQYWRPKPPAWPPRFARCV